MSRYSSAYSRLIQRLAEVEILQHFAHIKSLETPFPETISIVNSIFRGGVVLLSSHIEGYIENLGELAIDQIADRGILKTVFGTGFRYYFSKDIILGIRQSNQPKKIVEKLDTLIHRDSHLWDNNLYFTTNLNLQVFLKDFDNPTHERIRSFFLRFGYDSFEVDLARRLRADYQPCYVMINHVIDQRNRIAHGDLATGTPTDLAEMIRLAKLYCREADCVIANWFRSKGCPIR